MEEGEVIEHRWLSKAIENAQKRVEAHNFDIRKNLLEYDDVMNQQRKTIYKLRRQVLAAGAGVPLVEYDEDKKTKVKIRSEREVSLKDFKEMVLDALEDVIVNLTETYASKSNPATWDLEALSRTVKEAFNVEMTFQPTGTVAGAAGADLPAGGEALPRPREGLRRRLAPLLPGALPGDHRSAVEGPPAGDGPPAPGHRPARLRPEGPQARVQEARATRASFRCSRASRCSSSRRSCGRSRAPRPTQRKRQRVCSDRWSSAGAPPSRAAPPRTAASKRLPQKQVVREGPKVGRNDPCPCGSGKKYKKCHGAAAA